MIPDEIQIIDYQSCLDESSIICLHSYFKQVAGSIGNKVAVGIGTLIIEEKFELKTAVCRVDSSVDGNVGPC